jgi:chitosanase
MAETLTRSISCDACERDSDFLQRLGMVVHGCSAVAGSPGLCELRFHDPRLGDPEPEATPRARSRSRTAPGTSGAASAARPLVPAPLTATQVRTCKAIVNLFETSSVVGRYGQVTVLAGDTGQLTFGRSQTTLASGNLARLVARYVDNPAARLAARLRPYLGRLAARDVALNDDEHLKNLLRATADDPIMRDVQDSFFHDTYWKPAELACRRLGIHLALGVAIVYDSHVHGSWTTLRDRTVAAVGQPAQAGERAWLQRYVALRREWLATHRNVLLRQTVYRMDSFLRLMALQAWGLDLPLVVRGEEVSLATMSALPPDAFDGPEPGSRHLGLTAPMQRGLDVRLAQLGLSSHGIGVTADAVFGQGSRDAVMAYQQRQGLAVTGRLDADLVVRLAAA